MVSDLVLKLIYLDMNEQCDGCEEKVDYLLCLINKLNEQIDQMNWEP